MSLLNLEKMIDDLERFNWEQELTHIVEDHAEDIGDLQREQMLRGRDSNGEYIRPFYSENPYFETADAAAKYAEWKMRISPRSDRPMDVPNLYINGYFHNSIKATIQGGTYSLDSNVPLANKIEDVHKDVIGLNDESRGFFIDKITRPEITEVIKDKLGLTIKRR